MVGEAKAYDIVLTTIVAVGAIALFTSPKARSPSTPQMSPSEMGQGDSRYTRSWLAEEELLPRTTSAWLTLLSGLVFIAVSLVNGLKVFRMHVKFPFR